MQAAYNITNDTIFLNPSRRLTDEEYAQAKAANARWFPGRKVFAFKWSLAALDFLAQLGIDENEISEDDTPDDAAARVERFQEYAANAQDNAARAADYADEANTQRRRELAARRATNEAERAAYWNSRILGAISHARMKENPGVISRRVKELEADERKTQKTIESDTNFIEAWNDPTKELTLNRALAIANYGKVNGIWSKLHDGTMTPAEAREISTARHSERLARAQKVLNHLQMRLAYERALLDAMGGDPAAQAFEVGGAVVKRDWHGDGPKYCEILKVNKTTVEIRDPSYYWIQSGGVKIDKTKCAKILSRAEYEAIKAGQTQEA